MRFKHLLIAGIIGAGIGLSALADQYTPLGEKSRSEIVNEIAEKEQATAKSSRMAALEQCDAGDVEGCYSLAHHYRMGIGGLQNYYKAYKNYEIACDADLGQGCAGMAYLASRGLGTVKSQPKARALYEQSCDLGDATGCAGYGNMLFTGTGGRKDSIKGANVLNAACDRKVPISECKDPKLSDIEEQNCINQNASAEWACERAFELNSRLDDGGSWDRLKDLRSRSW